MVFGHEKVEILHLPTPLERLDNVSEDLGINVYCKRDDLTVPAFVISVVDTLIVGVEGG